MLLSGRCVDEVSGNALNFHHCAQHRFLSPRLTDYLKGDWQTHRAGAGAQAGVSRSYGREVLEVATRLGGQVAAACRSDKR